MAASAAVTPKRRAPSSKTCSGKTANRSPRSPANRVSGIPRWIPRCARDEVQLLRPYRSTASTVRSKHDSQRQREIVDISRLALRPVPADLDEVLQTQKEELGSHAVIPAVANPAVASRTKGALGAICSQPSNDVGLDRRGDLG